MPRRLRRIIDARILFLFAAFAVSGVAQPSQPYGGPNRTVYRPEKGVTNPEPIHKTGPPYTEKRQGETRRHRGVEVVVDEAGKSINAKVLRPLRPLELGSQ